MEVLYPHCAGLDVHKETVVACVRHMRDGTVKREVRTFKTTTTRSARLVGVAGVGGLHACRDGGDRRLLEAGLAHPERRRFRAGAGERAHVKNVPGRKTDVNDADLAGRSAGAWPDPRRASCRTRRPRSCAACCAPASNWCASGPATSSGCRGRWRTPTSSSNSVVSDVIGRERARHDRGPDRRRDRSGQAGRARPSADQGLA